MPWVPGLPRGRGGRGPAWGLLSQPYAYFVLHSRLPASARPPHLCRWSVTHALHRRCSHLVCCIAVLGSLGVGCGPEHADNAAVSPVSGAYYTVEVHLYGRCQIWSSFCPPWFPAACRLAVLGLQNFPSGAPKRAPRAELEACSDRTKSKEQRRRLAHVVNNYVARQHSRYSASTASTKLIVARSFCVEVESKLMLASRFDFPSASLASTSTKAPLLNTLSISLNLFRDIELCFLTKSSSFWSSSLSPSMSSRRIPRCPGSCKYCTLPSSHMQRSAYSSYLN